MLHHPGVKALGLAVDGAPERILPGVANAREARHLAAQAGHRQAALPALFHLIAQRRDQRVDQDRFRHRRRIGVTLVLPESEDHQCQVDPDLRRGQAGAASRVHGLEQVGDQRAHGRGVEFTHGLGDAQQARVAHLENFTNGHVGGSSVQDGGIDPAGLQKVQQGVFVE